MVPKFCPGPGGGSDHVTAPPPPVAVNCCVAPARTETDTGEIVMACAAVMFTVTEKDFVVSSIEVAVTVSLEPIAGALYVAVLAVEFVIVPDAAFHVTPPFAVKL